MMVRKEFPLTQRGLLLLPGFEGSLSMVSSSCAEGLHQTKKKKKMGFLLDLTVPLARLLIPCPNGFYPSSKGLYVGVLPHRYTRRGPRHSHVAATRDWGEGMWAVAEAHTSLPGRS